MRIHPVLAGFILISLISCQSPKPEEKEVLFDSAKALTDQIKVVTSDTIADSINKENLPEGPDSNFIRHKQEAGIDFFASGTEPFWSADLDLEKELSFKTIGDSTFKAQTLEKMKGDNLNMTRYHATGDSGEIIITILKKDCINAMSGYKSPYEVTIRLKQTNKKDFKEYMGCGQYTKAS